MEGAGSVLAGVVALDVGAGVTGAATAGATCAAGGAACSSPDSSAAIRVSSWRVRASIPMRAWRISASTSSAEASGRTGTAISTVRV